MVFFLSFSVISESLGRESSTSGHKSNTSSRVSINFPIIYFILITWFMQIKDSLIWPSPFMILVSHDNTIWRLVWSLQAAFINSVHHMFKDRTRVLNSKVSSTLVSSISTTKTNTKNTPLYVIEFLCWCLCDKRRA